MLLRERSTQYRVPSPEKKLGAGAKRELKKIEDQIKAGDAQASNWVQVLTSVNRLQFLARLEPHRFARRNRHFGSGARIASDAGFARAHIKHAKSPQLDAIA